MTSERRQLRFGITRESDRHRDIADHIFENQVPADDPGKNFAQRRIGIGIRAARNRNHRRQFGIAQSGKAARNRHQKKRNRNRRPCRRTPMHQRSRRAARAQKIHDQVEHLRVQDRRRLEIFPRRRRSRQHKNSRPDDGADPQRSQRPRPQSLAEPMLRILRLRNQLVDGFAAEKLAARCAVPYRRSQVVPRDNVSFTWTRRHGREARASINRNSE